MLGKFIFPEQSKTKADDFVMGVANKKQRLHSSQRLPWSLRMGWQGVSTTIFEWLLNLWLKMWTNYRVVAADNLLAKVKVKVIICKITYLQSKTKANDFVTGVANKKRCLRSSWRLLSSSRMGWQVVSTTIFDDSWIFDWRCDAWQIYLSRAIKNEGKWLRDGSSQQETTFAF